MKIMVTCPPMLGQIERFRPIFEAHGVELITPPVVQTLTVEELKDLLPQMDGWIIGDDPANREVLTAGKAGKLKAVVKWGVGVDNVDFDACKDLGLPVSNTPQMFGAEVADVVVNYVIGLARQTFQINRGVRAGEWPKPAGISLGGKKVALLGFGDIGRATAKRLAAMDMVLNVYDPYAQPVDGFTFRKYPEGLEEADFVVVTCALTPETHHMVNGDSFAQMKEGVRIVNVSRGGIIDEEALIKSLQNGKVHSAGLDVFAVEPLPADSPLRSMDQCIFGTHNGSNTVDAVIRASHKAMHLLFGFLEMPIQEEAFNASL
ncbi:MAG: phosphoglycerate dehydrogenase [Bacteroidota bacterium]